MADSHITTIYQAARQGLQTPVFIARNFPHVCTPWMGCVKWDSKYGRKADRTKNITKPVPFHFHWTHVSACSADRRNMRSSIKIAGCVHSVLSQSGREKCRGFPCDALIHPDLAACSEEVKKKNALIGFLQYQSGSIDGAGRPSSLR
jgi:hypothetical protein